MAQSGRYAHSTLRTALMAAIAAVVFVCGIMAQTNNRRQPAKQNKNEFTRPQPSRPIKPEIPSQDRYVTNKVFLEQADSLRHNNFANQAQIVNGNVKFRQGNMFLYCDSAYYYPENNSLDAFGHVRMVRGDTLFVYADKVFYDGMQKLARLRYGPTEPKVRVVNRDVTLTADSLFYSMSMDRGWYDCGGQLEDKVNVLTSVNGEYSTATKMAEFYTNVVLRSKENGNRMYTDTLFYNTSTNLAEIVSPTRIYSENDTIITTSGRYNTQTGDALLNERSIVAHRDSNNNVTTLEGDSIIYDKLTRISRAYMFRNPNKVGKPMILTDTAHKATLIGMYGEYNDSTRQAFATGFPLLIEYSRADTNFLRADTIRTRVVKQWEVTPYTAEQQLLADSLKALQKTLDASAGSLDSLARQDSALPADTINPLLQSLPNDTTAPMDTTELITEVSFDEELDKPGIPPPLDEETEQIELIQADNQNKAQPPKPPDSEESEVTEVAEMAEQPEVQKPKEPDLADLDPRLKRDSVEKEYNEAFAIGHARFFNQQLQAIADTMVYHQIDSLLHLRRKPIVWSEERQIKGDTIVVHFNDSTADFARVVNGFVSELVDESFYNQLKGKKMRAYFENKDLRRLEVDDNVEAILLPQENDSTYNKVIQAESEHLAMDMADKEMQKLKMWSAVDGTVTPIFKITSPPYLQNFSWNAVLRPKREWYEGRWRWDDDLGDISDELKEYFENE